MHFLADLTSAGNGLAAFVIIGTLAFRDNERLSAVIANPIQLYHQLLSDERQLLLIIKRTILKFIITRTSAQSRGHEIFDLNSMANLALPEKIG